MEHITCCEQTRQRQNTTLTMSPTYAHRCGNGTFADKAKCSGGQHSVDKIIPNTVKAHAKVCNLPKSRRIKWSPFSRRQIHKDVKIHVQCYMKNIFDFIISIIFISQVPQLIRLLLSTCAHSSLKPFHQGFCPSRAGFSLWQTVPRYYVCIYTHSHIPEY